MGDWDAGLTMDQPHIAQWNFVVSLYAKPEIKDACFALQNIGGVDIPILLAAIHASAKRSMKLERQEIMEMDRLADPLRKDFIRPLRALGTALKNATPQVKDSAPQTLRAKILEAELCAEREQLVVLAHYIESQPQRAASPDINATVQLVCDFYFEKKQACDEEIRKLSPSLRVFSQAVSSLI